MRCVVYKRMSGHFVCIRRGHLKRIRPVFTKFVAAAPIENFVLATNSSVSCVDISPFSML